MSASNSPVLACFPVKLYRRPPRWERFHSASRNDGGIDTGERGCTIISIVVGRVAGFIRGGYGGNNLDDQWDGIGYCYCRGWAGARGSSGKGESLQYYSNSSMHNSLT